MWCISLTEPLRWLTLSRCQQIDISRVTQSHVLNLPSLKPRAAAGFAVEDVNAMTSNCNCRILMRHDLDCFLISKNVLIRWIWERHVADIPALVTCFKFDLETSGILVPLIFHFWHFYPLTSWAGHRITLLCCHCEPLTLNGTLLCDFALRFRVKWKFNNFLPWKYYLLIKYVENLLNCWTYC